ncbi:hypothetical protein RJ639_011109 [Escallonia herrerae]|uniref:GDP-fucose pyrophosphorylase domain-containing protein n=1 Tax=Escallonia herrerae TaxID=1293975 RepID=A0AA88VLW0_9ASTE|nr:hypothetical protein RJ639_011109 [Escallonia herrerae]
MKSLHEGKKGSLFIMTGDVLPCFDAFSMVLPEDTSCIVTVPITLDVAANHGVVVASKTEISDETYLVSPVENLLQKPNLKELVKHQAILDDGRTLLDTGIIAVRGKAWVDLVSLSCSGQPMMSLYEDLVAAWVSARHEWLRPRPLDDLLFLHFGTSSEILDHLSGTGSGLVGRRHLCSIPATTVSDIAASAIILSSKIEPGVSIGEDSLLYDSSISGGVQIGSLSVVVGVNIPQGNDRTADNSFRFMLPDRHCLWEVPLVGCTRRVIVYCGLHDNPKISLLRDGTFCGKPWKKVLDDLGIRENDLWSSAGTQEKCLWNAKIFPVLPYFELLNLATWLMGLSNQSNDPLLPSWKLSQRVSLEELHGSIDFPQMCLGSSNHQADLAAGIVKACLSFGLLGQNLSQLFDEILQKEASGLKICEEFLALCPSLQAQNSKILPKSRAYQVQVDLLRACCNEMKACEMEHKVWAAVADETSSAVRYGFKEHLLESFNDTSATTYQGSQRNAHLNQSFYSKTVKVELPVRVDFVGGRSDTPPWSLERAGCVLNMAIS